jgi:copper(I)-binding protein
VSPEPVTARRLGIALAVVAALLTSACAAGQQAATANEKPTLDGANAEVGSINIRGAAIEPPDGNTPYYPTGSDVYVKVVLVNNGNKPDRLTSITSPVASGWGAYATTADAQAVVGAHAAKTSAHSVISNPVESTPPAPSTESGSAPGSPTSTPSRTRTHTRTHTAAPLPQPAGSVAIQPGGRTSFGTPESRGALLLIHVKKDLYPGTTISVTFTFANAGTVTFALPVALSYAPHTSIIPSPSTSAIE